jgi:hypothetical protein
VPTVLSYESGSHDIWRLGGALKKKEHDMGGELIGLVAVILGMGVPLGELNQAGRSRRAGILLVSGALGYIATFGWIAQIQADRDIWTVAAFGIIPLAVGIGYFLDWSFIRRDARASS